MPRRSDIDDIKQEYVTTAGAGKMLGVTVFTIRKWIKQGLLKAKKIDNNYFLKVDDIRKVFDNYKDIKTKK